MQRTGGTSEAELDTGAASNGHPHRDDRFSHSPPSAVPSTSTDPEAAADPDVADPEPSAADSDPPTDAGTAPAAGSDATAEADAGAGSAASASTAAAPADSSAESAEPAATSEFAATSEPAPAESAEPAATSDAKSAEPEPAESAEPAATSEPEPAEPAATSEAKPAGPEPAESAEPAATSEATPAAAQPAPAEHAAPDAPAELAAAEREDVLAEPAAGPGSTIWDTPSPAARAKRGPSKGGRIGRRVAVVLVTLLVMGLIPALVARMYAIPSESMETTLHGCAGCTNDRVLVDRMVYRFTDPVPGEVVVFKAGPDVWHNSEIQDPGPGNPIIAGLQDVAAHLGFRQSAGSDFVKRVIAVGGQTVSCCDERNRVIVDGIAVDEPYIHFLAEFGPAMQQPFGPVKVPEGTVFVMGDNRNASLDSRAPGNGPVPLSALAGKVRMIVYPLERFGGIVSKNPQLDGPSS